MIPYWPQSVLQPRRSLIGSHFNSAWQGLESVLDDILTRFNIGRSKALEFGVEYGYSTVALSNFFDEVIGVDTFEGDEDAGFHDADSFYPNVTKALSKFSNIKLIRSDYKDFIKNTDEHYDLIHIDIVHTYEDTYAAGDWAMQHADMVVFHDTESFEEVYRAVEDLSEKYNVDFYNYPEHYGLGILTKFEINR